MRLIPAFSSDALHNVEHRYVTELTPPHRGLTWHPTFPWAMGLGWGGSWCPTPAPAQASKGTEGAIKQRKNLTQNTEINKGGSFFVTLSLHRCFGLKGIGVSIVGFSETPPFLPLKSSSFVLKTQSTYARNQVRKTACSISLCYTRWVFQGVYFLVFWG